MKLHRGINTSSIAGEGLEGLPGLLIAIAFVFIFMGIFIPRNATTWLLVIFFLVEGIATAAYLASERRARREARELQQQFHRLNEREAQQPETAPSASDAHGKNGL